MSIQNDQSAAIEDTTFFADAAHGVLANDSAPNGPLTVARDLLRTAHGGQVFFETDGSYKYVSAAGYSGVDSVQYTALDSNGNAAGTATLTIDVAPAAHAPFVSVGSQTGERHLVAAGFGDSQDGALTTVFTPTVLSGGGYVLVVDYSEQAIGADLEIRTYDASHNLLNRFDPGVSMLSTKTVALKNGGFVVSWSTLDPVTFGDQIIHLQVFDATGATVAGPLTIDEPGTQDFTVNLTALSDGRFVLLHQDEAGQLFARTFSASGVPESQSYPVGDVNNFARLATFLPNGEIVMKQLGGANGDVLRLQRYDLHGNTIGPEIDTPSDGFRLAGGASLVASLPAGGFVVSWLSEHGASGPNASDLHTHILFVDAQGHAGSEIVAPNVFDVTTAFGVPTAPVTPLANGNFVVYWRGVVQGGDILNLGQVFDAAGSPVSGVITFNGFPPTGIDRVYALPQGGFAVAPSANNDLGDVANNLQIYDNAGVKIGDVRLEDLGDGSNNSQALLAKLASGEMLLLHTTFDETLVTSRNTTSTLTFNTATPIAENGITFDTAAKFPVRIFIPDPDGSEIVTSLDITGVPAGWTVSTTAGTAVQHGNVWTVVGSALAHGGTFDLVVTPNGSTGISNTIGIVAHTVESQNGAQAQSFAAPYTLTVQSASVTTGTSGDNSYTASGDQRFDGLGGTDTVTFGFKLVDATISFVGNQVVVDGPGGSHTVLTGFEVFQFTDGTVNNADSDRLVDDLFYYSHNHTAWTYHVDADADYHASGWKAGLDPNAFFSTSTYLSANPDVKAAGGDPLLHFDLLGWKEGRVPSIAFDPAAYLAANPDVKAAGVDPLKHYLEFGYHEGRFPFALDTLLAPNGFDYVYYLKKNPDVAAAHVDPLQHFETVGWKEGRNPNALFDTKGYLATYTEVKNAGVNPLDHFNEFGWREGRDPSISFDTTSYLSTYTDVNAAHVNPLIHFVQFGLQEGRSAFADGVWG